ncbi:SAM-dependent methyltransferase [Amycolatopsis bartoniae]|uniref:Methyltransferase n=1 Tax=Amycolatopsis bartoniae TaxID=941986 RepID=A0A8H9IUF2_9PSEU|nr:class I SAM-dependent methyltransferase [Amycolatopsis bartoniae]MBB2935798.1 SAM-dependent methyltransferase [Amycolatopsis bartoniae]TVT00282.1 class I SAM-dependent methyltransferase [Amycolatopsis bartoniae]GHF61928.1 methyltransferase [Amycolatopsis bartoniae]
MPFDHNHHYHPLLLRQMPAGARRALDVGCGTGRFARRLAGAGLEVEAVDPDGDAIAAARALGGNIRYRQEDITAAGLGRYDLITCLASLHHLPFSTVTRLRDALTPGGVLVVLGLAKPRSAADFGKWLVLGPPLNLAARAVVAAGERLNGGPDRTVPVRVRDWDMTMTDVRRESARLLPGSTVRPLVFWRYLLVYVNAGGTAPRRRR